MTDVAMSLDEVRALARRCLLANGCDEANADKWKNYKSLKTKVLSLKKSLRKCDKK